MLGNARDSSSQILEIGEAAVTKLGYSIGQKIKTTNEITAVLGEISEESAEGHEEDQDEERLKVFIEEPLDREDSFATEEVRLQKAINVADEAVTQLERAMRSFNTKNHPSFGE